MEIILYILENIIFFLVSCNFGNIYHKIYRRKKQKQVKDKAVGANYCLFCLESHEYSYSTFPWGLIKGFFGDWRGCFS